MTERALQSYDGKRVVVTGAGYIAAAIVRLLSDADCEIVMLRRASALALPKRVGRASIVDMAQGYWDRGAWQAAISGACAVIHLAAQTGARQADSDWVADYHGSVAPLALLLDACHAARTAPVVAYASSATLAGSPERLPADESTPTQLFGVYEIHKMLGEQYLANAVEKGAVRGAALRIPNVYGPGPVSSSGERGVLNRIVRSAMQTGKVSIYGDGAMMRDYLYVDDVAAAFLAVAPNVKALRLPAYVLAGDAPLSLTDAFNRAARSVEAATGRIVTVAHVPSPAGMQPVDFRSYYGNARAFRDATGWRPAVDFETGLRRTVSAMQSESEAGAWPR